MISESPYKIVINRTYVLIGITALLIGTLVYIVDRPPDQTYFIYSSGINISLYKTLPNVFGTIGNSLPVFIHVFSFILITAGLFSIQKRGCLIICISWFVVDSAFELGQKYNSWISKITPDWLAMVPFFENTEHYFVHGTFDFVDLIAIAIGSLMAYFVLLITMERDN